MGRRVALLLALLASPLLARALPPGDPVEGGRWSAQNVCQECHAADGSSLSPEYPRLGGQQQAYLAKQLEDFRSGRRRSVVMQALAQDLGDREIANIAAHFAAQPPVPAAGNRPGPGRQLFENGIPERQVPACAACHGSDARGRTVDGQAFPALAGQHRFYLRGQLLDWRAGARQNSAGGIMNIVAERLNDAEIEALAVYLSGL